MMVVLVLLIGKGSRKDEIPIKTPGDRRRDRLGIDTGAYFKHHPSVICKSGISFGKTYYLSRFTRYA
jgi:hypothetical protein